MGVSRQIIDNLIKAQTISLKEQVDRISSAGSKKSIKRVIDDATTAILKEVKNVCSNGSLDSMQQRNEIRRRALRYLTKKKRIFTLPNLSTPHSNERYPLIEAIDTVCSQLDQYTFIDEEKEDIIPELSNREQLFNDCREQGATESFEIKFILEKIYGIVLVFAEDFIASLNELDDVDFEEEISIEHINEIICLFEMLSEKIYEEFLKLINKRDLTFIKLRDATIDAILNFKFEFRYLTQDTAELFKNSVLTNVITILRDIDNLTALIESSENNDLMLNPDKVKKILLNDRIKCLNECTEEQKTEMYPITDDEIAYILDIYTSETNDNNGNIFETIADKVNHQFHCGLDFRTSSEIENLINSYNNPTKVCDVTDEEVAEIISQTASQADEEPEAEQVEPNDQEMFFGEPHTETEAEAEPEPVNNEEKNPIALDVDTVCYEVQEKLQRTITIVEENLNQLSLFAELLNMRSGFVDLVRKHYELRNPDLNEINENKSKLDEYLPKLRELKDEITAEVSALRAIESSALLASMKIRQSNPEDIDLCDAKFNENWDKIKRYLEIWEKLTSLFDQVQQLVDEIKKIDNFIIKIINEIQIGDKFFEKKIYDIALGADPEKIIGESNKELFEKNPELDAFMRGFNASIHFYRQILIIIDEKKSNLKIDAKNKIKEAFDLIKIAIEKTTKSQLEPEEEPEKEIVKVLESSNQSETIKIEFRNEIMELTPTQLNAILLTTAWGLRHKVWGLRIDKDHLNKHIADIFGGEMEDLNALAQELSPISQTVNEIRSLPPKKNLRESSDQLFIVWKFVHKHARSDSAQSLWCLPTYLAYDLAEALPEDIKLSIEAREKINAAKEKEKEDRMRSNKKWTEKFSKSK